MCNPMTAIARCCATPPEAVRWACVLEATAPKVGNVYPGKPFEDISHSDFVLAGEIASRGFAMTGDRVSKRTLEIVSQIQDRIGSNVNLGILLLLGPLVASEESYGHKIKDGGTWQKEVTRYLDHLDDEDGRLLFRAISMSRPGGMGKVDQMDVSEAQDAPIDFLAAMRSARDRDQIASEYSTGFADFFETVVPTVDSAISEVGDILNGIANAHLRLLASRPDTLIERKMGREVALHVQRRAQSVDPFDRNESDAFDRFLRSDGHRMNPGTTADLIAAALYVLLRQNYHQQASQ